MARTDLRDNALEQIDFYWQHWRPRVVGLTDKEYFWEPVEGCWSVRPVEDGFRMDFSLDEIDPPPFTTIAWRLGHIAGLFRARANDHFGDGSTRIDIHDCPGNADDALAHVEESYGMWRKGIGAMDAGRWAAAVGPAEGPFATDPYGKLVLHLSRELFHHGGEVALLRDLYRASDGGRSFRVAPAG